jgi:alkanesulfonate monooxygenase SsuD/methylene tetrahydromethanopterin reductase-like flavin-dependent oxidoreductase (luciferase family)
MDSRDESTPETQRETAQSVYDEAIEQIQLADKLGFETVCCVEHHFREKPKRSRRSTS